jgi:hypothetical protein
VAYRNFRTSRKTIPPIAIFLVVQCHLTDYLGLDYKSTVIAA